MNDDVYHLVKNTPKVTGFLGPNGKPQAITEAEAARMLDTKEEAAAAAPKAKIKVDYEIGDAVKVLDGPFASFNGVVEELDFDRSRVKVACRSSAAPRRSSSNSSRSSGSSSAEPPSPTTDLRQKSDLCRRAGEARPTFRQAALSCEARQDRRRRGFIPRPPS